MIRQKGKPPKLRGYAAQVRQLVPFARLLAEELLDPTNPVENAVIVGMYQLQQCYQCLSADGVWSPFILHEHSTKFALQYVALETAHAGSRERLWRIKPKLHLFLELCREGSKPSMFWCYRDEDFGGSIARLARRRGGLCSAQGMSSNMLNRFRMQPVIRVR